MSLPLPPSPKSADGENKLVSNSSFQLKLQNLFLFAYCFLKNNYLEIINEHISSLFNLWKLTHAKLLVS